MKIELKEISVRDIVNGYKDSGDDGVVGYDGKLDIRPPFQREFVYDTKQASAVIDTIRKGFPLNIMYWVKRDDGAYEVLDGQQRTISVGQYVDGVFAINHQYFHNLEAEEREQILDYKFMIYFCEGDTREKLDWFRIINIAGEKLTAQELRNAIYTGEWLADAKIYFSRPNCVAKKIASNYVNGAPKRQQYLETALKWINNKDVDGYMAEHQHDKDATELWLYFQKVINWVETLFPDYRKEMKGIDWGYLYNDHKDTAFAVSDLRDKVSELMNDPEVTNKKGIYTYLISGGERFLSLRAFDDSDKRTAFENQGGECIKCGNKFELKEMHADHIIPWSKGGKTVPSNLQMLCATCNAVKSNK